MQLGYFFLGFTASIFFLFSYYILYLKLYYIRNGRVIAGKVIAIEKYESRDTRKGKSILYRSLIEFSFNGELFYIYGPGSNSFIHKISQKVKLFNLSKGAEYTQYFGFVSNIFIISFSLAATISTLIYIFNIQESSLIIIHFVIYCCIYFVLYKIIERKSLLKRLKEDLLKSTLVDMDNRNYIDCFTTNNQIEDEKGNYTKLKLIIGLSFFLFMIVIGYLSWSNSPSSHQQVLIEFLKSPKDYLNLLDVIKSKSPLVGVIFSAIMCLLSIFSIIQTLHRHR